MTTQISRPSDCRDGNTLYGMGVGGRTTRVRCTCASRCRERNRLIASRNAAWHNKANNPALHTEREAELQVYMAEHYAQPSG